MNVCLSALLWFLNHHWHVEGTHTTSSLGELSWFSSELWTFMQFHKLVISEITFLTPKNSVLILHPPSIQHISQPLLCSSFCFAAPVVLLFLFRSPCCAPLSVSQPLLCCILESLLCSSFCFAAPAVLHLGAPAVLLFLEPLLCSSWFDGSVAASKICF